MKRLAKILYSVNSITFMCIALLHTSVHYQELVTPEIQAMLNQSIPLQGAEENVWKLWQGFSFMMGAFMFFFGATHFFIASQVNKNSYPPILGSILVLITLIIVTYSGLHFFGNMQFYGGIWGILLQSICLILSLRANQHEN